MVSSIDANTPQVTQETVLLLDELFSSENNSSSNQVENNQPVLQARLDGLIYIKPGTIIKVCFKFDMPTQVKVKGGSFPLVMFFQVENWKSTCTQNDFLNFLLVLATKFFLPVLSRETRLHSISVEFTEGEKHYFFSPVRFAYGTGLDGIVANTRFYIQLFGENKKIPRAVYLQGVDGSFRNFDQKPGLFFQKIENLEKFFIMDHISQGSDCASLRFVKPIYPKKTRGNKNVQSPRTDSFQVETIKMAVARGFVN